MAKKVVATLKKADAQNVSRVIKLVKSPKTGAYIYKEEIMLTEKSKEFFSRK